MKTIYNNYQDIKTFPRGSISYDAKLESLPLRIREFVEHDGLQLQPNFQRGKVWTDRQKSEFIEHILRGGDSGKSIFLNCPSWHGKADTEYDEFVLVDGLQRITAVTDFINNKVPAFGTYHGDFKGVMREYCQLTIHIATLQTEKEVLEWYITMNTGGTVHTDEDIQKVRILLDEL